MKTFLAACLALSLAATTASGQEFSKEFSIAYESALLDSLALYEQLKPTHQSLEYAYDAQRKETEALRNALRMSELYQRLQKEEFERQLADWREKEKRRRRWELLKKALAGAGLLYLLTR